MSFEYLPGSMSSEPSERDKSIADRLLAEFRGQKQLSQTAFFLSPNFSDVIDRVRPKDPTGDYSIWLSYERGEPVISGPRGTVPVPAQHYQAVNEMFAGSGNIMKIAYCFNEEHEPITLLRLGECKTIAYGSSGGINSNTGPIRPGYVSSGGINSNTGPIHPGWSDVFKQMSKRYE